MTVIGKKFSPPEFAEYCKTIGKQIWVDRIVLHNTASPSLAQRPGGILTQQHIQNLKGYYEGLGWKGGPHLFVDAEGIWVFNPLDKHGTHSPSWNSISWGVEMLGDYDVEEFTSGLGLKVHRNAASAIASLMNLQGWGAPTETNLRLHKEDPKTTHACPGKNVKKYSFILAVAAEMSGLPQAMKEAISPSLTVLGHSVPTRIIDGVAWNPTRLGFETAGLVVEYADGKIEVTK